MSISSLFVSRDEKSSFGINCWFVVRAQLSPQPETNPALIPPSFSQPVSHCDILKIREYDCRSFHLN
jgi:hypothetical protein